MEEIFKTLPAKYGPKYEVSNMGRLRTTTKSAVKYRTGSLAKYPHTTYIKVGLSHKGKSFTTHMHRLVAEAFIPNPDNKPFVNHKDKDGTNNSVDNLEWVTHSENMLHSAATKSPSVKAAHEKKRIESISATAFIAHKELIGTEFNGRKLVGLQYRPVKAGNTTVFKWEGLFECSNCAKEFTSPLNVTIQRFNAGKLQFCKGCSISNGKQNKDEDIV